MDHLFERAARFQATANLWLPLSPPLPRKGGGSRPSLPRPLGSSCTRRNRATSQHLFERHIGLPVVAKDTRPAAAAGHADARAALLACVILDRVLEPDPAAEILSAT